MAIPNRAREEKRAVIKWELRRLDNRVLESGAHTVVLRFGEGLQHFSHDFSAAMREHGAPNLVVRAWLEVDSEVVSHQTILLTAPHFFNLRAPQLPRKSNASATSSTRLLSRHRSIQRLVQFHLITNQIAQLTTSSICFQTNRTL